MFAVLPTPGLALRNGRHMANVVLANKVMANIVMANKVMANIVIAPELAVGNGRHRH